MDLNQANQIMEGLRGRLTEMPMMPIGGGVSLAGTSAEPQAAGTGAATPAYTVGAVNTSDVQATFDLYISSLIKALMDSNGMSQDEAENFVFGVIGDLEDMGTLPKWPDGGEASPDFMSVWLGHAKTSGLHYEIMRRASED